MKEACQVPVKKKRPPGKPERRVAKIKTKSVSGLFFDLIYRAKGVFLGVLARRFHIFRGRRDGRIGFRIEQRVPDWAG
jgi:hypothetical protein